MVLETFQFVKHNLIIDICDLKSIQIQSLIFKRS